MLKDKSTEELSKAIGEKLREITNSRLEADITSIHFLEDDLTKITFIVYENGK